MLTDDERELGVCLVDIGAGTTDIAIYTQGAIRYTKSLPVGGDQVTNDIAYGVQTPTSHAEEIKIKYACALAGMARADESIDPWRQQGHGGLDAGGISWRTSGFHGLGRAQRGLPVSAGVN